MPFTDIASPLLENTPVALLGVLLLLIGLVECFFGYRIFRFQVGLFGFLAGYSIGYGLLADPAAQSVFPVVLGVGLGVLLCLLSMRFFQLGVFCFVAYLVFLVIYLGTLPLTPLALWIALALGLIAGVVAVFLARPAIIVSTAFSGAGLILQGGLSLLGWQRSDWLGLLTFLLTVLFTAAGIWFQWKTTKKRSNKKKVKNTKNSP